MIVLGIDPGLACTGYGLVRRRARKLEAIEYGVIRPGKERGGLAERIGVIHEQLRALVQQHEPDCLAVEQVFKGPNVQSLVKLCHARAAALLAGTGMGLAVAEYTPMQIKRAVTGRGGADKEQVAFMVARLLGLAKEVRPLDASDALAAAICHLNSA